LQPAAAKRLAAASPSPPTEPVMSAHLLFRAFFGTRQVYPA
jgi:hypothetical protein